MNSRLKLIVFSTIAIIVAALMLIDTPSDKTTITDGLRSDIGQGQPQKNASDDSHTLNAAEINGHATIANKWEWGNQLKASNTSKEDQNDGAQLPFTEQSVHDALQAVKVDEHGDVILDHEALMSLDETLERIYNLLDPDSLLTLQNLIEEALPGKTGVQTAKLVRDYQQFLQAKEQFDQIHAAAPSSVGPKTVAAIEGDQRLYRQLQTLREVHLGRDITQRLFHDSDVNAQYMFESIKVGLNTSLSQDEIASARELIETRRREQMGESEKTDKPDADF